MEEMVMNRQFWQGRRVFITGHTGFKGSWLSIWLKQLGANVTGYSLAPPTLPSLFEQGQVSENMTSICGDVRDATCLYKCIDKAEPEVIFHLAAQSLVRESYLDPTETYSTNVMGSLNVLEAARKVKSVQSLVMVSTDKCYENKELSIGYSEEDRLGGFDPYSSSKACLELLVNSYRQSFTSDTSNDLNIATVRAGNVIGGGDYAKDRLIPDILKVIESNKPLNLRYPNATRPWQHVLEPLSGYLSVAEKLFIKGKSFAQAWNFGPDESNEKTVEWVSQQLIKLFASKSKIAVEVGVQPHETTYLKLNADKARTLLNWQPIWNIEETLSKVYEWQTNQSLSTNDMCIKQIDEYCGAMSQAV